VDNTPGDKLGVWRDMRLADALVSGCITRYMLDMRVSPFPCQHGLPHRAGKSITHMHLRRHQMPGLFDSSGVLNCVLDFNALFLSRVSTMTCDIDIAILSVRLSVMFRRY